MTAGFGLIGTGHGRTSAAGTLLCAILAATLATTPLWAAPTADPAPETKPATGNSDKDAGKSVGPVLLDKDKPIEITSDRLDVDQQAQTAVFEGKVDAIQGTFRLTADRLTVHYDQPQGEEGSKKTDASLSDDPGNGSRRIRRMDVVGNIKIVSPTETATGDTAVYEVEKGTIDLMGNVVLTRGQNVIRGTMLTTNVDTGKSVIKGTNQSVGGANGRVKSLFVPEKKDEDQTKKEDDQKSSKKP